jgi:prevent-host-death family protein
MYIKPSKDLRNDYASISNLCKESGEPVFFTKNGEGDLVVMSIEAYEKLKKEQDDRTKEALLADELIASLDYVLNGGKTSTISEFRDKMRSMIDEKFGTDFRAV